MPAADTGLSAAPPSPRIVWRLTKAAYASCDGEGARLFGGRWNHPGQPVVYASGSLSLAALEYFVNLDTDLTPPDLVSVRIDIPDEVDLTAVAVEDLPRSWRRSPGPPALQELGTHWSLTGETAVLIVPSAVVPQESNYLLNPRHPEFARIVIGEPDPFHFDSRMWK